MRNDLYVTLEKGEFEKGGKSVARNVEISVHVLGADGQILKVSCVIITQNIVNHIQYCPVRSIGKNEILESI